MDMKITIMLPRKFFDYFSTHFLDSFATIRTPISPSVNRRFLREMGEDSMTEGQTISVLQNNEPDPNRSLKNFVPD